MKKELLFLIALFISQLSFGSNEPILIAELTLKVGAMSTEKLHYGFAEGDELIFDLEVVKGKKIKEVKIIEYPNSSVFMDFQSVGISQKKIQIKNTGVYSFHLFNGAVGGKVCKIKIQRIPSSESSIDFDSTVKWNTISDTTWTTKTENYVVSEKYETVEIQSPQKFYINSTSNETFKGGNSKINVPLKFPKNTVEWYYVFSASRNEVEIDKTASSLSLGSELATVLDQTGALGFALNSLTQPPGADYASIYLYGYVNYNSGGQYSPIFSGSRENFKSGLVQIKDANYENQYLLIKNDDFSHGIHVAIEVTAITLVQEIGERIINIPKVQTKEEPFLLN